MRNKMVIACCGALMMAGCAASSPPPAPIVLDLAPKRCPALAAADLRALDQRPLPPPPGDITQGQARAWIDGLGLQVETMRRAGLRVVLQYHRCRGKTAAS